MNFSYKNIKKSGIENGREVQLTVAALDVVEFTVLGNNEAFVDAVEKLESTLTRVMRKVEWDLPKSQNNDAILNPTGDGYFIGFNET